MAAYERLLITLSISVCVSLLVKALDECYYQAEIVPSMNESSNLLNLPLARVFSLSTRWSV